MQFCELYRIKAPEPETVKTRVAPGQAATSGAMMNRDGQDDEWVKAKSLCRLSDDEVRMARDLWIGPRALIKSIPNPKERWKAQWRSGSAICTRKG
jgi:hypothetical protein